MSDHDPAAVHALLQGNGETLATAESLTGGLLATLLTDVPGASRSYLGGVVVYATSVKQTVLGVPQAVVDEYGVVSAACAEAMAAGVRDRTGATYGLSTTGVAGPDRQEGKPVGTVFVGVAGPTGTHSVELALRGDRSAVRNGTCEAALSVLGALLADDTRIPRREESDLG